jgi:hypothetical protein
MLSALQTRKDAGGVVEAALVGKFAAVPDDIIQAYDSVPA